MNKKIKIAVYGAGGFGREVMWLAQSSKISGKPVEPVCFIDDDQTIWGSTLNGLKVLSLFQAKNMYPDAWVVSGIGPPRIREQTIRKAKSAGFGFATLIHPRIEMSKWVEMGEGTVVCAGNILTTNIVLGKHVQINLKCTVGHDVIMGDYATLAPGVHVSGCVHIGKRVYIGTGAVITNGTQNDPVVIADDTVIGAGACVTKSITRGTWVGVPAKKISTRYAMNTKEK